MLDEKRAQSSLASPSDVGDPPPVPELDEIKHDGTRLTQVSNETVALAFSALISRTLTSTALISQSWASMNGSMSSVETSPRLAALLRSLMISAASLGSKWRFTAASLSSGFPFPSLIL